MTAYLDNSATTMVCEEAINKMCECMRYGWGNPSSTHEMGLRACEFIDQARSAVAEFLSCKEKEIIFTSGATESNNLAIKGAVEKYKKREGRIVTTAIEHPSVARVMDKLENDGFEVVRLKPSKNAAVSVEDLEKAIDEKTVLVSVMAVNNELGSIQPFDKVKSIIKKKNSPALLHVDAVQAFGKMPLKPESMGIDLMSASSHKIHGPKGVGLLYINEKVKIHAQTYGGEQENGIRPGTEATAGIAGFGQAVKELKNVNEQLKKMTSARNDFLVKLKSIEGVSINSPDDALPYIVNISVGSLRSETALNFLSSLNIYVSSGSACAKGKRSRVLEQAGLSPERIDSALRISMSRYTRREELDMFIDGLKKAMERIRRR